MAVIRKNAGNSGAEDRFIEIFCDTFGAEKGQYVYLQYPMVDIYGGHSLDRFRGESSLKSWLCTIARNLWVSECRKKETKPMDAAATLADPAAGPEECILQQSESMRIHRLLHDLDEPYREVFMLRTLGQLSFRNIGELFGKSQNWACVVYSRARARIRERMEETL